MKKITLLSILGLMLFSCSGDDSGSGAGNNDGQGGSLASFVLRDNYLYTVDDRTINVFKLQNTEVPVKINDVGVGSRIETLFSQGNYLYVGSQTGMYIYSLQNPQNPVKISSAQHLTACDPVVSNRTCNVCDAALQYTLRQ
ncbi:hypothetical protein [Flavobacterium sp. 3HN19-14]|uniref:hypothetical protein n=1 Tax=Flavobacterium sp. 3HN19-14 TaxID=3448133 RepID=UPI003EE26CD3